MAAEQYILVIRLSAMGDVALITPVLRAVDRGEYKLLVLTRSMFASFFAGLEGVEVFSPDFKVRHRGIRGIFRLFHDIRKKYNIFLVIDLHSVIRTWILDFLFGLAGRKSFRIDKDRRQKRNFVRSKVEISLLHTTERYSDVFRRAGLRVGPEIIPSFIVGEEAEREASALVDENVSKGSYLVGVSPFSKHKTKEWGLDNMRDLLSLLKSENDIFFILFGGMEDIEGLSVLASSFPDCYIAAGKHSLSTELALIRRLRFMISMDSANMHLAALSGISTISIWGGTHPAMGFSPAGNQKHIIVQTPNSLLGCRPCSVYGGKDCIRKDIKYKCMKVISPDDVMAKIKLLNKTIADKD